MNGPRFLDIDLQFGRHSGLFALPQGGPVVIAGANGSGKTTLVDALFRTVYGFRRQRHADRELLDSRRPWGGGACQAQVRIELPDGTQLTWQRDFESDLVLVEQSDGEVLFDGEAKAGGKGSAADRYSRLVRSVFGHEDLEVLSRTTWVAQGELRHTAFDSDLLPLAEGGHASVDSARSHIVEAHKELTREPITPAGRTLPKNRILENQLAELAGCQSQLAAARTLERTRGPALERLSGLDAEEATLASEIEALDGAHGSLLKRQAATATADLARSRLDGVVQLRDDLEAAEKEAAAASRELEGRIGLGEYPDDFGIRASRLKVAWSQLEESVSQASPPGRAPALAAWAAGGMIALGTTLEIMGRSGGRYAIMLGFIAAAGALIEARRRRSRSEARDGQRTILQREIRAILEGVPHAETVTPETLPDRLESFQRQATSRQRLIQARTQLEDLETKVERLAAGAGSPGRSLALLQADAERELAACETKVRDLESEIPDELPGGVEQIPRVVKAALDQRRMAAAALTEERRALEVRLAGSARIAGVEALEEECRTLEAQIENTRRSVEAHRAAHALIEEGYADFREHDEARLVESVATRLRDVGGVFGEFRAGEGLENPTVAIDSRAVGLESRQLSHGQSLVAKLAVRIGTADFLGVSGVAAPLVVDDPFAHLDNDNAARVWALLSRVAETRQVIVTTQETELLARLGVAEGIVLLPGAGPGQHNGDRTC